jgi:hypothetical protein
MTYMYVFAAALRLLHSSAAAPPWNTLRFQPIHWCVLVWPGQPDLQDSCSHRRRGCHGVLVRPDRNPVRLLSQGGQELVSKHITNLLYMPSPNPVVYVVPLSHILGRLPLIPAGDCYPRGSCDKRGAQGSGSKLFYINQWAMIWPTDYPAGGRWSNKWVDLNRIQARDTSRFSHIQTYTDRYRQIHTDTFTVLLCEFPIHAYINEYKQIHAISQHDSPQHVQSLYMPVYVCIYAI